MYLKKSVRKKSGRIYLVIAQKYRNPRTGVSTDRTIKSLGYLDELEKKYDDPLKFFKAVAREMTEEEDRKKHLAITLDMDEFLPKNAEGTKNLGYAVPLRIHYDLGLHTFLKTEAANRGLDFNANSIMILLVIVRILVPGIKKRAFEIRDRYFGQFNFERDDVYRALTFFDDISESIQKFIHEKMTSKYGRDMSIIYYDKANYYFDRKSNDSIQYDSNVKQSRHKPIMQMGLALDKDGVPIHYELSSGNMPVGETFRIIINEIMQSYTSERFVVVANMGTLTDDSICYLARNQSTASHNGYIFGFPISRCPDELKDFVLDKSNYKDRRGRPATTDSDFIIKSRTVKRSLNVTLENGITREVANLEEKQVVYWSRRLLLKARTDRGDVITKANDIIANPKRYNKSTANVAADYVSHLSFDEKTGEIIEWDSVLILDRAKIMEEEKYDGYYLVVTSEIAKDDNDLVDTYRRLREIDDAFENIKNDMAARPVYVRSSGHTNAHFLIYFIALTILRLMQKKTGNNYSAADIISCLNRIVCTHEMENIYLLAFRNEISEALGRAFGVEFSKKRLHLSEINKILNASKK